MLYYEILEALGLEPGATRTAEQDPFVSTRPKPSAVQSEKPQPTPTPWRDVVGGWPQDLQEDWQERAAIREYDGGLPRQEAEACAFEDIRARTQGTPSQVSDSAKLN